MSNYHYFYQVWNLQKKKKTSVKKKWTSRDRGTIEKEESVAREGRGGGDLAEDKAIRLIWITRFPFLPMPAAWTVERRGVPQAPLTHRTTFPSFSAR